MTKYFCPFCHETVKPKASDTNHEDKAFCDVCDELVKYVDIDELETLIKINQRVPGENISYFTI
jgi:hypothetical protein